MWQLEKIGAWIAHRGRYVIIQMIEAALPRELFAGILGLINGLRGLPADTVSA